MTKIFQDFVADILVSIFSVFDAGLMWMLEGMLYVEKMLSGSFTSFLSSQNIQSAYRYLYTLAVYVIVLKLLFKGFQIYILWRDGDADSSPHDMVVGAIQALAVVALFPLLYDSLTAITMEIVDRLMTVFNVTAVDSSYFAIIIATGFSGMNLIVLLLMLIFIIMALVLCVKMISRGFELLILRVGVPLACIGLIDSDYGVFKTYMQTLLRAVITSIVQIILMSLSFRIITGMNFLSIVLGIGTVSMAFATPTLLQQILIPSSRGGGVMNKIYSTSMVVRSVKGLVSGGK